MGKHLLALLSYHSDRSPNRESNGEWRKDGARCFEFPLFFDVIGPWKIHVLIIDKDSRWEELY